MYNERDKKLIIDCRLMSLGSFQTWLSNPHENAVTFARIFSLPFAAKVLPEESVIFSRIPLVDLPATLPSGLDPEPFPSETKPLSAKPSREREKDVKTPDPEEDDKNKKRYLILFSYFRDTDTSFPIFPKVWFLIVT